MKISIEDLARAIAPRVWGAEDTLALARKINETEGWVFERSAPQGHVLRVEISAVDDELLIKAHDLAMANINEYY